MKRHLIFFYSFLLISIVAISQRKQVNCQGDTVKYLSIGKEHKGIGLGNPSDYKGVRLSLVDKNCITNGVTLNMFSDLHSRRTNGVDIGFSQSAGSVNGVSIGLLGNNIDNELRGFGFGTFLSEGLNIYGVSITGGFQRADKFHGVGIAGIMFRSFETRGLVASGLVLMNDSSFNGVALTSTFSRITILNGFSTAIINWCDEVRGFQLGLINKTDYMKGAQIGAINIITENPKWARVFPLINFGFKSNPVNINLGGSGGDIFVADPCKNGTLDYAIIAESIKADSAGRKNLPANPVSADSLVLSFEIPLNSKNIEFYLDEKLVYPIKEQAVDTSASKKEVFVTFKKSSENFIKVINKEQKKCMESSWKPNYSILRLSVPDLSTGSFLMTYTNSFLTTKKEN